ncbi:hypothetical protein LC612_41595 [Nostoc sp. CHAB 5834]|nr:hypothetical protein [Nostoc sp. CHAB 5834]
MNKALLSDLPSPTADNVLEKQYLLCTSLAMDAIRIFGRQRTVIHATLDVDKPETMESFELLQQAMLHAYKRGLADALDYQAKTGAS